MANTGWTRRTLALLTAGALLAAPAAAGAQARRWDIPAPKAPPGEIVLPITGAAPAAAPPESWSMSSNDNVPVVANVSTPTLTPFLPAPGKATGAAVIIAPGGAFYMLAMEHEGWALARYLQAHGVAAFVLKYRVHPTEPKAVGLDKGLAALGGLPRPAQLAALDEGARIATQDAQAALRLVHARAAAWHVDPARIGVLGFSAGAITTMSLVYADAPDARPAFIAPIYGGLDAPRQPVPSHPPPMFAAMAADDPLFGKTDFALIPAWKANGGAVELHLYEHGGHGFGFPGRPGTTTLGWADQFLAWMRAQGLLTTARAPGA